MQHAVEARFGIIPCPLDAQLHIRPQFRCFAKPRDISEQPFWLGEVIIPKGYERPARTGVNFCDMCGACIQLHLNQRQQIFSFFRKRTKSVDHFRAKGLNFCRRLQFIQSAIQAHAQIKVWHIGIGNEHGRIDGNLRRKVTQTLLA